LRTKKKENDNRRMKRQLPIITATTMVSLCAFNSLQSMLWMLVLPCASGFVVSQSGCNTGKYCNNNIDEVFASYFPSTRRITQSTTSTFLFDEAYASTISTASAPSSSCYVKDLFELQVESKNKEAAVIEKTECGVQEEDRVTTDNEVTEREVTGDNLPPVMRHIADERAQFNMNLGKAMDTLRKDMPDILRKSPDFSIYHDQIIAVDPSGVRLQGLDKYKSSFAFIQTFVSFWFMVDHSKIQFRMVYDFCRSSIKLSWHVVLLPKMDFAGNVKPVFLDGISTYDLDASTGKIVKHEISNLSINNNSVVPPYNVFSLIASQQYKGQGVQVGVGL